LPLPIPSTHVSLLDDLRSDGARENAWAVFHVRYRDVIFGWCLRRGLPPDAAEDLTQDALLKLFQQLPRYRHDPARGQFRGWLKTVVGNILTDFWRRQQRQPKHLAIGGTTFLNRVAWVSDADAAVELSTIIEGRAQPCAAEIVERVRGKLKETTWQAFYQMIVDRRQAAEVAAELNMSVAAVYKSTYRVKQMLIEEYSHARAGGPNAVSESGCASASSE
jgi:RNA polymerase sigma factor (sigma-70 family)